MWRFYHQLHFKVILMLTAIQKRTSITIATTIKYQSSLYYLNFTAYNSSVLAQHVPIARARFRDPSEFYAAQVDTRKNHTALLGGRHVTLYYIIIN